MEYKSKLHRRKYDKSDTTHTNTAKPRSCKAVQGQVKNSQPRSKLTIQIPIVRHVSAVLLAVAFTCLVTLNPNRLKNPIEMAIATLDQMTWVLPVIWAQPRERSKKGDEVLYWTMIGKNKRTLKKPKNPSHATASRGGMLYTDMIFSSTTNCVAVL